MLLEKREKRVNFWCFFSLKNTILFQGSLQVINAGEGVEKREPSYTVGGNPLHFKSHVLSSEMPQETM